MKNQARNLFILGFSLSSLVWLAGCGGGSGGTGDDFDNLNRTTGVTMTSQVDVISAGWSLLGKRAFPEAAANFMKVLNDNPTAAQKYEALAGLGFAMTRKDSAVAGIEYFEQAWPNNHDAKAGYAGALISRNAQGDMDKVIKVIEAIEPKNPLKFTYKPKEETGVCNADLHAMLAYAYFCKGDLNNASIHIEYAKANNPTNSESVTAIGLVISDLL